MKMNEQDTPCARCFHYVEAPNDFDFDQCLAEPGADDTAVDERGLITHCRLFRPI